MINDLTRNSGQMLVVGFDGTALPRSVGSALSDGHIGGTILFARNIIEPDQVADLNHQIYQAAGEGLLPFVSVDQEGGRVQRLKEPLTRIPPMLEVGKTGNPRLAMRIGKVLGSELEALGFNLDYAPDADVWTNPENTVIGDRSFSSDPATVTTYAGAFARGLRDAGVLPVLKHFPGHGSGSGDSHTAGVVSTPPLSDLMDSDLVPYRTLVAEAPVAVMMGHLEVPGLTGNNPASLSAAAVNLLRSGGYGGPGFNGLVFSDDLSSMAAISSRYGVAEAVLRALQAGTDVALWITTDEVPAVLDRLGSAVGSGELAMPAVEGSVLRLAGVKGPSARCGG